MGKSKNKKSKKSEVDEVGGRYKIKYDEDGNMSLEKVASEEEVLNELFSAVNKNKSNEIPEDAEKMGLWDGLDKLFDAIEGPYKARDNFSLSKVEGAISEFNNLSSEAKDLIVNDNVLKGILLMANVIKEIIAAIASDGPVEAEHYQNLLYELHEIETFYKNNSNDMNHKKLN